MKLSDYKVLTFDCYGTLIDWETGIFDALRPLVDKAGGSRERNKVLAAFAEHESAQQDETPNMRYSDLLSVVYRKLATDWGVDITDTEAERFGHTVPDWPAFPDSTDALSYLKQHYTLVILSNVDRVSFAGSNKRLKVEFDEIYTAEDIGSYKPNPKNFTYMLSQLQAKGFSRSDILHTAQSLFHDHIPATEFGLATAWIDRRHDQEGWGATMPPPRDARIDFHFNSLAEFVKQHRAETA